MHIRLDVVDPSLFVDRIVSALSLPPVVNVTSQESEKRNKQLLQKIREQSLQILSIAKKDWLLVGRIPSAVAGAAVLIALRANNIEYPADDVANSLHVASRYIRSVGM